MQHGYGPDEADWGRANLGGQRVNLYAEQLRGTEGAVLSRASNTYGMLTTDDPFQYLGGLALAVRHLDGKAPALYIANARGRDPRLEDAAGFLAKEQATRQFHPGYIQGLMQEGHAGTLQVLDALNNFWGWTAVAREIVRDDQWDEFVEVYVRDKHRLGLKRWFEAHNPHALAQTLERMLEAARQGYWQADARTVAELKRRWREIARRHDVQSSNAAFRDFVGFGLVAPAAPAAPAAPSPPAAQAEVAPAPPPQVRGMELRPQTQAAPMPSADWLLHALVLVGLALAMAAGAARQRSAGADFSSPSLQES
jgi:cobaltochelatase CobN